MPSAPRQGAFPCDLCDKTFSRREYVDRHKRLAHLGLKPFECVCDKKYARSDLLRRHKKTCALALAQESPDGVNLPPARARKPKAKKQQSQSESPQDPPTASTSGSYEYGQRYAPPSLSPSSAQDHSSDQSSPHTPYAIASEPAINVPHTQSHYSNYVPVGFTPDELMATEVLEDLLRSPQFSKAAPSTTNHHLSSMASTAPATASGLSATANVEATLISPGVAQRSGYDFGLVSSAPHAAQTSAAADNTTTTLQHSHHSNKVMTHDPSLDLEFTPEAVALADYFNKGGVGGITALDFGFSYEPSLLPDHMFEPQVVHTEQERKFFIPNERFALGYTMPWRMPPTEVLSRFASHAAESFLPSIPVVHAGSMVMTELPPHTAFALTVAGAAYDAEGETFSNEMLVQKRLHIVRTFNDETKSWQDKFACAQSLLLYQLLGLFHKDETQRILSHTFHGAMIMMLRQLELVKAVTETEITVPPLGTPAEQVQATWKLWIQRETWRRVIFIMYMIDLEIATRFACAPLLPFCELTVALPSCEELWNAADAQVWQQKYLSVQTPRCVSFVEAVRMLLSPNITETFTLDQALLVDISQLGTLPLLVLTKTLSYFEQKTEEAIKQSDPFRTMLNSLGMSDSKESENLDLLRRIRRGKSLLSMMPKAAKDDGKRWFEEVMPNGPPKTASHTHIKMEDHMREASQELRSRWPLFANEKSFI